MTREERTADPAQQETTVQRAYDTICRAHKQINTTAALTRYDKKVLRYYFEGYATAIRNILTALAIRELQIEEQQQNNNKNKQTEPCISPSPSPSSP